MREGREDLHTRRCGRSPGCAALGAGARLPLGFVERCVSAARGRQLEALKWAWEHDCPWDEINVSRRRLGAWTPGAGLGHGCPWNKANARLHANARGRTEVVGGHVGG